LIRVIVGVRTKVPDDDRSETVLFNHLQMRSRVLFR
jgi:hypothetical protein